MTLPSSPRIRCTRRLEFDAAHRVMEHESKCRHLHGHRYVIEASFEAAELDALDRVIDFGVIKERLGAWIDEHWDHATILNVRDRALGDAIAAQTAQRIYYIEGNPTAEKMAEYLFTAICPRLFAEAGVRCTKLRLYETPNCYADIQ
jgi:6-pyruvoyltetrahydropterin/6-carboxytetrahydropterin synthase